MRFPNVLAILALSLALPPYAATLSLSGTVTDAVANKGLPGVRVSLAKEGSSTTTAADGSWSIPPGGTTGLSGRDPAAAALRAAHLSIQNGRIVLRYRGRDLLGHALSGTPSGASGRRSVAASPAVFGRSADAGEAVDTIFFSWKDTVRLRLPIESYTGSGISTVLDTSSIFSTYGIPWNGSIAYEMLLDSRDGRAYRTVKIGSQTWMAENLNYRNTTGSSDTVGVCYNNSPDSCSKYGRLYTWSQVMNGSSPNSLQGICPAGWHVPGDVEWTTLTNYVGSSTAGTQLKSMSGWISGNGTDRYGFRGLPAGYSRGSFLGVRNYGFWWSATEDISGYAWSRDMYYGFANVPRGSNVEASELSLRCIKSSDSSETSTAPAGMRLIPGGTFTMGSPTTEANRYSDETQHSVTVSSFYMDSTDVTQGQYQTLMKVNPSIFTSCGTTCPVEYVTWFDAVLYCNARSKQDGLDTVYSYTGMTGIYGNGVSDLAGITANLGKNGYRLPTEAQWEYAARGGTTTAYYWGNDTSTATVGKYAWYENNSGSMTHPVATKLPNAYGLYDMAGNVWKWTNDWYGTYSTTASTDPTGPSSGTFWVNRGGCWYFAATSLRSAARNYGAPGNRYYGSGFRCVRPGPPDL